VLLRPQWRSWLVRGGNALVLFGGVLLLQIGAYRLGYEHLANWLSVPGVLLAIIVSVYTAFLFAQARGRDFWQSPLLPLHMLVHSLLAGSALLVLLDSAGVFVHLVDFIKPWYGIAIVLNLLILLVELTITHPTSDAKATVRMILKGRYKSGFWWVVVAGCNLFPLIGVLFFSQSPVVMFLSALAGLIGIYRTERIWLEAPQRIPLA
jgi:formate-dependent nitrite reductase membrane component NrfD